MRNPHEITKTKHTIPMQRQRLKNQTTNTGGYTNREKQNGIATVEHRNKTTSGENTSVTTPNIANNQYKQRNTELRNTKTRTQFTKPNHTTALPEKQSSQLR